MQLWSDFLLLTLKRFYAVKLLISERFLGNLNKLTHVLINLEIKRFLIRQKGTNLIQLKKRLLI